METKTVNLTRRVPFNPVFRAANRSRARYRVLMGGAGSGKSKKHAEQAAAREALQCLRRRER